MMRQSRAARSKSQASAIDRHASGLPVPVRHLMAHVGGARGFGTTRTAYAAVNLHKLAAGDLSLGDIIAFLPGLHAVEIACRIRDKELPRDALHQPWYAVFDAGKPDRHRPHAH